MVSIKVLPNHRRRRGMILPAAAVMGLVMLGLAGIYFSSMRNQDTRGRRFAGHVAGRHLARGAVEYVLHLVRDASDPQAPGQKSVDPTRSFRDLARHPAGALAEVVRAMKKGGSILGPADDRKLVDPLFGVGAVKPLDELEAGLPGAELRLEIDFTAGPFPGGPEWLADSVAKTFVTSVRAEVLCGGAREVAEGRETSVVYPLTPPVLGRFTGDTGIVWHDPAGGPREDPLDPERPDMALFEGGPAVSGPSKLAEQYADRGWAYPRTYVIQAGGGVGGQHGLLWKPVEGRSQSPRAAVLAQQPRARGGALQDPTDETVFQEALVAGVVQGSSDPDATASLPSGKLLREQGGFSSTYAQAAPPSVERRVGENPYGTSLDPSPTYAPGSRAWVFASSAMTMDRNSRSTDEADQRAEVGVDLPRWEGLVYDLTPASNDAGALRDAFEIDERGGETTLLPGPEPGQTGLPNRNLLADRDGDGFPETQVGCEIPFAFLGLDPAAWRVSARFESPADYAGVASRIVELPLSYCLSLAGRPLAESEAALRDLAWKAGDLAGLAAWDEPLRLLEHRDPLHRAGKPEDRRHYYRPDEDEQKAQRAKPAPDPPGLLAPPADRDEDLPPPALADDFASVEQFAGSRWMPTLEVWGQEDLLRYFPDGDLGGYRVLVGSRVKREPPYLKLAGDGFHSGALASQIVEISGGIPAQEPDRLLEVAAASLFVAAGDAQKRVALYGGITPVQARDAGPPALAMVEGGAYTSTSLVLPISLATPERLDAKLAEIQGRYKPTLLGTRWDPVRDPVGPERHLAYRVAWAGH